MTEACLDDDVLSRFCEGLVDAEEAEHVRAHARGCEACHRVLIECLAVRATGTAPLPDAARRPALAGRTERLPATPSPHRGGTAPLAKAAPVETKAKELVAGRYRLERILGAGGMGVVYEATRVSDGARFAVKTLRGKRAGDREFESRLRREGRILASMTSRNVVRLFETGELATGEPYVVMELLDGTDLHSVVTEGRPLRAEIVRQIMIDVCRALDEAHRLGVIHRDVKPHNLFLAREPGGQVVVKVLDFGLGTAPVGAESSFAATQADALLGSPHYMAPEQIRGARVDPRADIYALGATAYTLLTGKPPHAGRSVGMVLSDVLSRPATPLRERMPEVPESLAAIVDRCLEKDPAKRYASASELAQALERPAAPNRRALHVAIGVLALVALGATVWLQSR